MPEPRVTVIVPAFNAAPFIAEAVESVLAQTSDGLRLVVVDDGSTDGTLAALQPYARDVTILSQANGGAARARNRGARDAGSEWLAFLDADDAWLPGKIARQLEMADQPTALVYTDRVNVGDLRGLPAVQSEIQPLHDGDLFERLLSDGNFITTSGVMVRRAVFESVGGFCEDARVLPAEDWDLWLRVCESHPARACRTPLVRYRLHASGVSRAPLRMNRARVNVVRRALALPRGRRLGPGVRRRIWAETWTTNGWDAGRARRRVEAALAYARAIGWAPFRRTAYLGLLRVALGRS